MLTKEKGIEMRISNSKKTVAQVVLLVLGLLMVFYGAYRGEVATVLGKAIKLCLECVGIG